MILQSLTQLYERLKGDPDYQLPTPGYSIQNVTFRIVLNSDGSLHDIQDARQTVTETTKSGKAKTKQVARQTFAPDLGGRSRNTKAYFLCDKLSYLTGFDLKPNRADLAKEHFEASLKRHLEARDLIDNEDYKAVCRFYETFDKDQHIEKLEAIAKSSASPVGVFRVLPSHQDVHEQNDIAVFWRERGKTIKSENEEEAVLDQSRFSTAKE